MKRNSATHMQIRASVDDRDAQDVWFDCKPKQSLEERSEPRNTSRNGSKSSANKNSKVAQLDGQYMPADVRWTYGAIVKAYVNAGNVQAVRRWLSEMSEAGFKPSREFYEELLQMCLRRNLKDLASEISALMLKTCDPRPVPVRESRGANHQKSVPMVEIVEKLNSLVRSQEPVEVPRKAVEIVQIPTPPGLEPPPGLESEVRIEHFSL